MRLRNLHRRRRSNSRTNSGKVVRCGRRLAGLAALACILTGSGARAQIDATNWGRVTAPVYGTSEQGVYAGVELFAGPRKFGDNYFWGVLPNGRVVKPAGASIQIGMNPLGLALTPDGKYLVTSNADEREGRFGKQTPLPSLQSAVNQGGYSLTVVDTGTMKVVSQIESGPVFGGLQITGAGPYTVWAAGGASNTVRLFDLSPDGTLKPQQPEGILIAPMLPANEGFVSHYTPDAAFNAAASKPPVPTGFDRDKGAQITFPAGLALSPDGKFLYVACNGDNSMAVIDTTTRTVVKQVAVGYFPYSVSVSHDGGKILVSNWGMEEYKFKTPVYDSSTGKLKSITPTGPNLPDGFYVPVTHTKGTNPKTSSVSIVAAPGGDGKNAALTGALYEGLPLDALQQVGDTHPSATAIVRRGTVEVLYVAKSNSDSLGLIRLDTGRRLHDFDLAPVEIKMRDGHKVHGAYPNAIAATPDGSRTYVAEAGTDTVAVLNTEDPMRPRLLGRIPTGWYPTGLTLSADGRTLYIVNAKGIGEDINPKADLTLGSHPTGVEAFEDSNFVFGSLQKVDLATQQPDSTNVHANNYAMQTVGDTAIVPIVPIGGKPSAKIKHVFFIMMENKTFDSMLGNLGAQFGPFASMEFTNRDGAAYTDRQYTGVALNTQTLAGAFATAVNYYSDAEESDAGHQFCASGTSTDYTQKTPLVKSGRGLLVNKNMEPEDYPEGGYIFNNAARHNVSFKDYGDLIRIVGTDTGTSVPTTLNDPLSGKVGYPTLQANKLDVVNPLANAGDVDSPTQGMGQSYFLALPDLAVLGGKNPTGEARLDRNYPGYNFNISDQRRALEFAKDFDRMTQQHTLPQYLHIYLPNDHTGSVQAPNKAEVGASPLQQIADGDVALGMTIRHIMSSPAYYDPATGEGSAIFITYDDSQSSLDHIHPHRTPLIVVSPYAKPGYAGKRHYVSASIVKTEELLLGLPPNNYGDLFATDLRDLFQPAYNHITAAGLAFTRTVQVSPTPEGARIWALVKDLDTSAPDRDSRRLGRLSRLSIRADEIHVEAAKADRLNTPDYREAQNRLYQEAQQLVKMPSHDDD